MIKKLHYFYRENFDAPFKLTDEPKDEPGRDGFERSPDAAVLIIEAVDGSVMAQG